MIEFREIILYWEILIPGDSSEVYPHV
jgi:hypothetical protein